MELSTAVPRSNPRNLINVVLFGLPATGLSAADDARLRRRHQRRAIGGAARVHAFALAVPRRRGATDEEINRTSGRLEAALVTVALNVNGRLHAVAADPQTLLLYVLRTICS